MFRDGYYAPLDELRAAAREGKDWIAQLQQRAIEDTGIKSLKVRYTSVFGYFIEVTKSNLGAVPPHWHRKQTVANGERFITPELKEVEGKILGADERGQARWSTSCSCSSATRCSPSCPRCKRPPPPSRTLDVLCAPRRDRAPLRLLPPGAGRETLRIRITDGRHPVLDQSLVEEKFVPNDIVLDGDENRLLILTGPNMAGKSPTSARSRCSCSWRRSARWVPAKDARDRPRRPHLHPRRRERRPLARPIHLHGRDERDREHPQQRHRALAWSSSMKSAAAPRTFDGLSIAWSVAEYLHDEVEGAHALRHALPRAHRARAAPAAACATTTSPCASGTTRSSSCARSSTAARTKATASRSRASPACRPRSSPAPRKSSRNLEQHELNADGQPALAETAPSPTRRRKSAATPPPEPALRPQLSLF